MSLLKKLSQLEKKKKIIPSLLKQKSCPIKKKIKKKRKQRPNQSDSIMPN